MFIRLFCRFSALPHGSRGGGDLCGTLWDCLSRLMTKPTMWLCTKRRHRSAWTSAQSDQSLRCPPEESLGPKLPIKRTAKTDQTGRMPSWSESSLGAQSFSVGFVMRRLIFNCFFHVFCNQMKISIAEGFIQIHFIVSVFVEMFYSVLFLYFFFLICDCFGVCYFLFSVTFNVPGWVIGGGGGEGRGAGGYVGHASFVKNIVLKLQT